MPATFTDPGPGPGPRTRTPDPDPGPGPRTTNHEERTTKNEERLSPDSSAHLSISRAAAPLFHNFYGNCIDI